MFFDKNKQAKIVYMVVGYTQKRSILDSTAALYILIDELPINQSQKCILVTDKN